MAVRAIAGWEIKLKKNLTNPRAVFEVWDDHDTRKNITVPVAAAWVNPFTKFCIRAHFQVQMYRPDQKELFDAAEAYPSGMAVVIDDMTLMAHRQCGMALLRFGALTHHKYHDQHSQHTYAFYTCKQVLLRELCKFLHQWNPVVGTDNIDFSVVPNYWLEELGAIMIPDILKRSTSMWAIDMSKMMHKVAAEHGFGVYNLNPIAKKILTNLKQIAAGE